MKLSVIIPCYNIERQIGRCLDSVLAQEGPELEVIAVDDGSTDDTAKICERYAAENACMRVIHQENKGLGPARNTGIEAATGEILSLVDGDDWILPGMYARMTAAMEEAGAQMAVCRYLQVSDGETGQTVSGSAGEADDRVLTREEALFALVAEDEATVIQNAAWNKLYRRELFLPEQNPEGKLQYPAHRYEDIVITAKLIARCEHVVYLDEAFYAYVVDRQGSIMNRSALSDLLKEQIPSYWERDAFFEETGRHELAVMHDYIVGKKLLALRTEGRRKKERESVCALGQVIRERYAPRFSEIYGCPIADPHHALRMRLFLIHPVLYDLFTAINEGILLPLRGL